MTTKTMTRVEAETRLAEIADPVARALGYQVDPWEDDRTHIVRLLAPEGFHIYLSVGYSGGYGSVAVSGELPRDGKGREIYLGHNVTLPKINVGLTRPPHAIASSILSRLVPEYVAIWEVAQERSKATGKHESTTQENAEALAAIVEVPRSEIREGKFSLYRSEKFPESISDVEVSGQECKLILHLSVDDAKKVLKFMVRAT